MACPDGCRSACRVAELGSLGDAQLLADQVDPKISSVTGALDLQTGVHLGRKENSARSSS